jgi:hypothetical protein
MSKAMKGALAFAAGFGQGYFNQKDKEAERARRDEELQMRRDEHDVRMRDATRQEQDRVALIDAAKPVAVNDQAATLHLGDGQQHLYQDAGVANSDLRQATRLQEAAQAPAAGGAAAPADDVALTAATPPPSAPKMAPALTVGGQLQPDRATADAAAASQNSPEARDARIADALRTRGKPTEAMTYTETAQKHADSLWNRQVRDAMTRGHQGIAEFLTNSQADRLKGRKFEAVPSEDGKTVTYAEVGPDGTRTPTQYTLPNDQNGVIQAGYQLSRADPETRYKHMIELDKQGQTNKLKESELALRERLLNEVRIPLATAQAEAATTRADAAKLRAERPGGGGAEAKVDSEDRKRWTSLHDSAERTIKNLAADLRAKQANTLWSINSKKPGTPEATELQDLQAEISRQRSNSDLYAGLLGGKKLKDAQADQPEPAAARPAPGAKPAAGAAPQPAGKNATASGVPAPKTKAEYAALPPGARYQHPDDPPGEYRRKPKTAKPATP